MSRDPLTVSELTKIIKDTIEANPSLTNVWLSGEISNLTYHSSGHIYFSLKDENSVIQATFFKYANRNLSFRLEEGMAVIVLGNISIYGKRSTYQINIQALQPAGLGELQKRIEELKKRLSEEGLFDPAIKKKVPFFPLRVGLVTSPTGAALRDILKVALRRFPNLSVLIAPATVQGMEAPAAIAHALETLNSGDYELDCIIVGRGGGSFEDLMPFNEEVVVRAIAASRVPVLSAVGHQIDHPLSDDVADAAAPTPSAAAEMLIPDVRELHNEVSYYLTRCERALISRLERISDRLYSLQNRRVFTDPMQLLTMRQMWLTELENRIKYALSSSLNEARRRLQEIPDMSLLENKILESSRYRYRLVLQKLESISPLAVLKRGYAIVRDSEGEIVRGVRSMKHGDEITLTLQDGSAHGRVESTEPEEM